MFWREDRDYMKASRRSRVNVRHVSHYGSQQQGYHVWLYRFNLMKYFMFTEVVQKYY